MSRPIFIVDGLGKAYQLGQKKETYPTLREALVGAAKAPLRRLRNLNEEPIRAETFWALRDVSFEVQPGEVVGIIGRNGAGKSTLLKILSRITEPTEGCIRLRGRVASLLEVGTGFHSELTGRENIYLNGSILGMRKAEIDRKFDEIVAFAEIEKFLDTPVKHYSSGMYVRLAFAVAAHLEPQILVVDEVLAVGDTVFQKKCLGKMQEVTEEGRTVLFVSHNMAAVRSLCHTGCLLSKGCLVLRSSIDDCVNAYVEQAMADELVWSARFPTLHTDAPQMRSATLSADAVGTGTVRMGDVLRLAVEFESPTPLQYPRLGFIISNHEGQRLLNANNHYQPSNPLASPTTKGTIICDLGMVPLMPGRYAISLWFGNSGHDSHIVEDALTFEVVEHDAWGLGQTPPRSSSALWWPTRFEIHAPPVLPGKRENDRPTLHHPIEAT
ncbi:MAG: ABC transporter ATP-binding protein [Solirubrobacterales bacterium]